MACRREERRPKGDRRDLLSVGPASRTRNNRKQNQVLDSRKNPLLVKEVN